MRKFRKAINIGLVFMSIGALLCQDLYALRIPVNGSKRVGKTLASGEGMKTHITKIPVVNYALPNANLKIAMVQLSRPELETLGDIKQYMATIERTIEDFMSTIDKSQRPDLILLPEGLCECFYLLEKIDLGLLDRTVREGLKPIVEFSKKEKITIGLGALLDNHMIRGDAPSYVIITPKGELIINIKHRFLDEKRVIEINGIKMGIAICREFEFQSLIEKFKKSKLDIILLPMGGGMELGEDHAPIEDYASIAEENNLEVAIVNSAYTSHANLTGGGSRATWWAENSENILSADKEGIAITGFNKNKNIPANISIGKDPFIPIRIVRNEGKVLENKTRSTIDNIDKLLEKDDAPRKELGQEVIRLEALFREFKIHLQRRILDEKDEHIKILLESVEATASHYIANSLVAMQGLVDKTDLEDCRKRFLIIKEVITGLAGISDVRMRRYLGYTYMLHISNVTEEDINLSYPVSSLEDIEMEKIERFLERAGQQSQTLASEELVHKAIVFDSPKGEFKAVRLTAQNFKTYKEEILEIAQKMPDTAPAKGISALDAYDETNTIGYVLIKNGKLVGYRTSKIGLKGKTTMLSLWTIGVDPEYRNQGLGNVLLWLVASEAQKSLFSAMEARVQEDNIDTWQFLEHRGFFTRDTVGDYALLGANTSSVIKKTESKMKENQITLASGQEIKKTVGRNTTQEDVRSQMLALIKNGKIINKEQAVAFLESLFQEQEIDLNTCNEILGWFNTLAINKIIDVKHIKTIQIGKDNHVIDLIQEEKSFTPQELDEIISILDKIPREIRQDLKSIARVYKTPEDIKDALVVAYPGEGQIIVPDSFYSKQVNHNGANITYIRNKDKREESFIHEIFEVYVTGENKNFIDERMIRLDHDANLPLNALVQKIRAIKKDIEPTLLIRWIKAKKYELKENFLKDYFYEHPYLSNWAKRINESDLISPEEKIEMLEMFNMVAMILGCWDYKDIWKPNKYEVSQHAVNPSEDLIESCCKYFLNGDLYRQQAAMSFQKDEDLTHLITYLMLRNGPFNGLDYGLDKKGQGVTILYLGDSVNNERHYHIKGPTWYGKTLIGNIDTHIFLKNNTLSLIGTERNIALPETVGMGEKLLTEKLRHKL